jgi:hypothetical protein
MTKKIKQSLALTFSLLLLLACTSDADKYREQITQLRSEVRANFSPKFDPIWIAKEKKAAAAKKEIARLIGVMEDALQQMDSFEPPPEMRELHRTHEALFTDCIKALQAIEVEAAQPAPKGMKAVRLYQEMTSKFLEVDDGSEI